MNVLGGTQTLLSNLLPHDFGLAEQIGDIDGTLWASEIAALGSNVAVSRSKTFAAGRTCARAALQQLGFPPSAIMAGGRGEPQWPLGVVGSITHCEGYCAAVATHDTSYFSVGIDAEPNNPLPSNVLELISSAAEREIISAVHTDKIASDRLLFCVKETLYKAWYPIEKTWLDFKDANVRFDWSGGRYQAQILKSSKSFPSIVSGTFLVRNNVLIAATVVMSRRHSRILAE